jgi:hypothetical protein
LRPGSPKTALLETEHRVQKLKAWLPKGPTDSGGYRERDIIQFYAVDGGLRTTYVSNLILL